MIQEQLEIIEVQLFIWNFQLFQEKKALDQGLKAVWMKVILNNKINSQILEKNKSKKRFLAKKNLVFKMYPLLITKILILLIIIN